MSVADVTRTDDEVVLVSCVSHSYEDGTEVRLCGLDFVARRGQRVAVLGILNKRNGIVQNVALHPGQSIRWKDVIVRLRACETTAPWEEEKLTGAFVQIDVQQPDKKWNRIFSGWLYKERPNINVVQHPIYDVWVKSCAMSFPATGPETARLSSPAPRSSARKSPAASGDAAEPTAPANASDSSER